MIPDNFFENNYHVGSYRIGRKSACIFYGKSPEHLDGGHTCCVQFGKWTHRKSVPPDPPRKRWSCLKVERIDFQSQLEQYNFLAEIRGWKHQPWYGIKTIRGERRDFFFMNRKGLFLPRMFNTHIRILLKHEMIFSGNLKKSTSCWTKSPTPQAKKRIISDSTETYCRLDNHSYNLRCNERHSYR